MTPYPSSRVSARVGRPLPVRPAARDGAAAASGWRPCGARTPSAADRRSDASRSWPGCATRRRAGPEVFRLHQRTHDASPRSAVGGWRVRSWPPPPSRRDRPAHRGSAPAHKPIGDRAPRFRIGPWLVPSGGRDPCRSDGPGPVSRCGSSRRRSLPPDPSARPQPDRRRGPRPGLPGSGCPSQGCRSAQARVGGPGH
ncbi:Uncharacterised protein [Mycobacterium tuberculosis]|nr:Uncharacterised protein [Mycobacterium tuberculosis]SGP14306.1 Uncharacterised protein [Mycobacterium tuberculosis]